MRKLIIGLLTVALSMLGAGTALACSCVPSTEQENYDRAGAVFEAVLVDRQDPPDDEWDESSRLTFIVTKVYKGEVERVQEITTASSGAACGLEISRPGWYLVFADEQADALSASLCGGTRDRVGSPPEFE